MRIADLMDSLNDTTSTVYRKSPCMVQAKFSVHAMPSAPQTARSDSKWNGSMGCGARRSQMMKMGMHNMPIMSGARTFEVAHCDEVPPAMVKGWRRQLLQSSRFES